MTSNHHFYDIKPTIFDIISTVSLSSHPRYWWYHTNCFYEISSSLYDDIIYITSQKLYMTSHTWHHKHYICHLTHYIWHCINYIHVIKPSVSNIQHNLSGWHHTHYIYDIIFIMYGITWTLYDITPPLHFSKGMQ